MNLLLIIKKKGRIKGRGMLLPVLVLTLIAITGCLTPAIAQNRNNQSDWNVPPPLAPRNLIKGDIAAKNTAAKPVLILSDIPAIAQPPGPPVQMPVLAAIGTTVPVVNIPDQPNGRGDGIVLNDIPMPAAPDAPPLPKQNLHDAPVTAVPDLPVPESPELPPLPAEPIPSAQTATISGAIPVMPDIVSPPELSLPPAGDLDPWSTPGIPENASFKLVIPPANNRSGAGKGTKKVKSTSVKH
jgi:hypothetical protein